jgi:hypothetical protein
MEIGKKQTIFESKKGQNEKSVCLQSPTQVNTEPLSWRECGSYDTRIRNL